MKISQKCYYALRALCELARDGNQEPHSIAAIGKSQEIPPLFLQSILRELKQSGLVESRRGKEGGYVLALPLREITVGKVIRFFEGDLAPAACAAADPPSCKRRRACALREVWQDAAQAASRIYDGVTLADLLERERAKKMESGEDYAI